MKRASVETWLSWILLGVCLVGSRLFRPWLAQPLRRQDLFWIVWIVWLLIESRAAMTRTQQHRRAEELWDELRQRERQTWEEQHV